MKQLFFSIIIALFPVSVLSQDNVRKALSNIEKASDINMSITNVVKRNPNNKKIEMKVFTVGNLRPKYIREVGKAIDKDAAKATYDRVESSQGTVVRVVRFSDKKSQLNVVLTYGPGGGTLVVREDFDNNKSKKNDTKKLKKLYNEIGKIDFQEFENLMNLKELKSLSNLVNLKDLASLANLRILINDCDLDVNIPQPSVTFNRRVTDGGKIVEVTTQGGVVCVNLTSI